MMEVKAAENEQNVEEKTICRKSAEIILKIIANYPFGLFKVEMKDLVAKMITEDLAEFVLFIESCAKTPSFLKSIDRAKLKYEETCGAFVFDENEVWSADPDTFNYENKNAEEKIVVFKVVDIPYLHHYTDCNDN